MYGNLHRAALECTGGQKANYYKIIRTSASFQFHMEYFLLLFPKSSAGIFEYSLAGYVCYLLYDRKLSGKEMVRVAFHTLYFMVAFCNLPQWLYFSI